MASTEWDIGLYQNTKTGRPAQLTLPAAIGAALAERGMWRAKISITEDGILLRPYVAERRQRSAPRGLVAELPWTDA